MSNDNTKYGAAFGFLTSLGIGGADLANFIKTYGVDVAAHQLDVDAPALRKMLEAIGPVVAMQRTLREVAVRRGTASIPMNTKQRDNFVELVKAMCAQFGATAVARRLGVARQTLYYAMSTGGPHAVSPLVLSLTSLLGYDTCAVFLEHLSAGIPKWGHITKKNLR